MQRSTRHLLILLATIPAVILVFALLYQLGMTYLEGQPRDFLSSIEWAVETLTTTGYGHDALWHHPAMVVLVIAGQFTGIFLVFLIFPFYILPYLEERFELRLPRVLPKLQDDVLIYRFGPTVDSLLEELQRFHVPSVVIEEDETIARRLHERGLKVVLANLGERDFDLSGIQGARAIVANGEDHDNAVLITLARASGFKGPIHAFAEDPLHRPAMEHAGATTTITPRHVLAAALAAQASDRISPEISGVRQISEQVSVSEMRVHADSPLAGLTIAQAAIRERYGATIVAQWLHGKFIPETHAHTRIHPGAILVAIGSPDALERLGEVLHPLSKTGTFVVAGYGEVGQKVAQLLRDAGERVLVVNDRAMEGVDVVGNLLQQPTLVAAGIRRASAVILALGNDSETLFAAAVIREHNPEVPIIARVNLPKSVDLMYRVGADFVLSVSVVAGQMLARQLLGEAYVSVEPRLKIIKIPPGKLAGKHPWEPGIRERTDCHIVAIERNGRVRVEFPEDFRVEAQDCIYICGTPEALDAYQKIMLESKTDRTT